MARLAGASRSSRARADVTPPHIITSTLGERLKYALVPSGLYMRYRVAKERRHGEPEVHLLRYLIDPKKDAIDAGAGKGVYTYLMARLARHVHAFEPNPKMHRLLSRLASGRVTTYPLALSDQSGTAELRVPYGSKGHSNQGASLNAAKVRDSFTPITVQTTRIDDLAITEVGFIKIDVEGFEAAVLAGAAATIARDRPNLLIEIEEQFTGIPIERSLDLLRRLDYEGLFLLNGDLRSLASFDPERHHRGRVGGYVFNFIFLPKGRR